MAITRFQDLPSTSTPINSTNLNGNFDELGAKLGTSIDSNYRTNIIKGKNLFDYNDFLERNNLSINDDIISSTSIATSSWTYSNCNYYITLKPGTYTISLFFTNQETNSSSGCRVLNSNGNSLLNLGGSSMTNVDKVTGTFSINTEQNIGVMIKLSNGTLKLQIEKGNGTSTYEKYITPTINVDGEDIYVKGQNDFYSTQEQVIGTWFGKPLYRKVIVENGPVVTTDGTNANKNIDISSLNADALLIKNAWVYQNSRFIPVFYMNDAMTNYAKVYPTTSSNLRLSCSNTTYSEKPFYVILEYTKTTD